MVLGCLGGVIDWWNGLDTSEKAGWIEAVSTALAFLAAGVAVVFTFRLLKREEARDEAFAERERRQQASMVTGWIAKVPTNVAEQDGFTISNASDGVVTNIRVQLAALGGGGGIVGEQIVIAVLPPHAEHTQVFAPDVAALNPVAAGLDLRPVFTFVDSATRTWSRDLLNRLHLEREALPDDGITGTH